MEGSQWEGPKKALNAESAAADPSEKLSPEKVKKTLPDGPVSEARAERLSHRCVQKALDDAISQRKNPFGSAIVRKPGGIAGYIDAEHPLKHPPSIMLKVENEVWIHDGLPQKGDRPVLDQIPDCRLPARAFI